MRKRRRRRRGGGGVRVGKELVRNIHGREGLGGVFNVILSPVMKDCHKYGSLRQALTVSGHEQWSGEGRSAGF